jgi:hypothetical protein
MNVETLQAIAEVLVMAIPFAIVSIGGLLLLSRSQIGEAVAQRIAGAPRSSVIQEQIETLHEAVAELPNQLSEVQERVDFAERLISRAEENRGAALHQ